MKVISNSSPLIALSVIRKVVIFKNLFKRIMIPEAVYKEVVEDCSENSEKEYLNGLINDFIDVVKPNKYYNSNRKLDIGEVEVLSLCLEQKPDIIVMDDRKARNEAIELGFRTSLYYTTDIIKEAENRGYIKSYQQIIFDIKTSNIYLPELPNINNS